MWKDVYIEGKNEAEWMRRYRGWSMCTNHLVQEIHSGVQLHSNVTVLNTICHVFQNR